MTDTTADLWALAFFDAATFLPLPLPLFSAMSIVAFIVPFLAKNSRSFFTQKLSSTKV